MDGLQMVILSVDKQLLAIRLRLGLGKGLSLEPG
jgi:hypothetical protein